jgi:hypothetical protein
MTKSPAQLEREVAEALLKVGQRFDYIGHVYEITRIGRDKLRTVTIARRLRDPFGKEILVDHRSFPARDFDRQHLRALR